MRAIHFSCLGTPMPTQTTSGRLRSMSATTAASSSAVSSRNGGAWPPTICQARVAQPQRAGELHQRALVAAAVEVEAQPGASGPRAGAVHQLGAVDAVGQRVPERRSAHTSGWPSGTVKSASKTAARSSGSSWLAITVCTAATQT